VAQAPSSFELYSGDDGMTLPLLAVGAVGVVGVATHWSGVDHQEMFGLWAKGDVEGARRVNDRLLESFAFETGDEAPNPIPTKAMLRLMGLPGGRCRLPMGPEPDWVESRAREVLDNLHAARGT
jgi:4-hydroxy-tetrahydrodipicolinate synthase